VVLELPELLAIAGGYAQQYKAVQLHLHWGSPVAHAGSNYFLLALPSAACPTLVSVLQFCGGSVLRVGPRENLYYRQILEHLYRIEGEDEEVFVPGFNIAGLLPSNLNLYLCYNGSLTTRPCYQTLKWTVFNQTVQLSQDQISQLVTTLRGDDDSPLQDNFRGIQKLHGRHWTTLWLVKQLPPGDYAHCNAPALAGDVLAVLFGVLFAVTALAFLLYIHKHRSQNTRLDNLTKSKVIYTAAT
ncbi:Carbonic anhydrase 9, partial [Tinamus guttatus]